MPKSAWVIRRLVELIQRGQKFIMPNRCDLIAPEDMRQAHFDLLKLPYRVTIFEAPWVKEGDDGRGTVGEFQQEPATKRIALCWELSDDFELIPGLNQFFGANFEQGGVFLVSIYYAADRKRWSVPCGGMFVPYENIYEAGEVAERPQATQLAIAAMAAAGKIKGDPDHVRQFAAEPWPLLPEPFDLAAAKLGSVSKVKAMVQVDSHDELQMLIQACAVINCANVDTATIEPAEALNKKRLASGKQPFFSYKVLQLTGEGMAGAASAAGGTHASPRMHLRRGHLRRLERKTIWVRPTMVSASTEAGFVMKDYAVARPPAPPAA